MAARRRHETEVHHKGHDTANHQRQHTLIQTHRLQKALESGQCIVHDNHREAPPAAGKNTGIDNSVVYPISHCAGASFPVLRTRPEKRNFKTGPSGLWAKAQHGFSLAGASGLCQEAQAHGSSLAWQVGLVANRPASRYTYLVPGIDMHAYT